MNKIIIYLKDNRIKNQTLTLHQSGRPMKLDEIIAGYEAHFKACTILELRTRLASHIEDVIEKKKTA